MSFDLVSRLNSKDLIISQMRNIENELLSMVKKPYIDEVTKVKDDISKASSEDKFLMEIYKYFKSESDEIYNFSKEAIEHLKALSVALGKIFPKGEDDSLNMTVLSKCVERALEKISVNQSEVEKIYKKLVESYNKFLKAEGNDITLVYEQGIITANYMNLREEDNQISHELYKVRENYNHILGMLRKYNIDFEDFMESEQPGNN